jgi:hemolysin D
MNAIARHWDIVRTSLAEEKARAGAVFRVEESAFLPAALEIIERPVSPTARVTTWVLLIGLVLTVLWLTFGRIDVVASAQGRLIPADNVKLVQPAEAGIVRAILVRDGQRVKKGQPLVELDPTVSTAESVQASKALETAELDAARSRAILAALDGRGMAFVAPPGTPADVAATQAALARAQLDELLAGISGHSAERRMAAASRAEALVETTKLTETLPLLDEQIAAHEKLLEKGFTSKLKVIEMRRQRLAAAKDRDVSIETANRASAQMDAAGSGFLQSRAEARSRTLSELAKAEADAKLRRAELTKAFQRSSLQRLLAPVDGTVTQLAVHTIGGVVEPARPIMVVVPSGGPLIAEVKLLNKDAGFVHAGQEVAIKLDAFPFTRYGTSPGRVEWISADAIEDEKAQAGQGGGTELIYTVRIALNPSSIGRGDTQLSLSPGMSVIADIRTGRRSIISYLLSPLNETRLRAARER